MEEKEDNGLTIKRSDVDSKIHVTGKFFEIKKTTHKESGKTVENKVVICTLYCEAPNSIKNILFKYRSLLRPNKDFPGLDSDFSVKAFAINRGDDIYDEEKGKRIAYKKAVIKSIDYVNKQIKYILDDVLPDLKILSQITLMNREHKEFLKLKLLDTITRSE